MKSKKAYAYFVELALAIIIIFIVLSSYIESEQTVFNYKQDQNMRQNSWYLLKNINDFGAMDSTNLSKVNIYVDASLGDFTAFDLEFYNSTGCFPVYSGIISSTNYTRCESINATTKNDIVSTFYTFTQNSEANSVRLYLWRKI